MQPIRAALALGFLLAALGFSGCSGGGSSSSVSDDPVEGAPVASFTFAPATPASGETVVFTDTSTGNPTSWSWTFGDGGTSSLQNPSHSYSAVGSFTVRLTATSPGGSNTETREVSVAPGGPASLGSFPGNIVLGSPTGMSIKVSVLSPEEGGTVYLACGTSPNAYSRQPPPAALTGGKPLELVLDGLSEDTRYYYRLYFEPHTGTAFGPTEEYTFHTARPPGSPFTFTIQADPVGRP